MTHDVVALLENRPTMRGMTRALVHADPGARVRTVAEGAVVEMRDDSGRLLAAAQAGQRLSGLDEVRRLLGGGDAVVWRSGAGTDPARTPLPERPWWVEARGGELGADGTGTGNDADTDTADMARRFAAALVAQFGGYIWEAKPRLRRDDPLLLERPTTPPSPCPPSGWRSRCRTGPWCRCRRGSSTRSPGRGGSSARSSWSPRPRRG